MRPTCRICALAHLAGVYITAATASGSRCTTSPVTVRLAPSLQDPSSPAPSWEAPTDSFQWGTWFMTESSNPTYKQLYNLQAFFSPVLASCTGATSHDCPLGTYPGQRVDLTTYTLPPSNASDPGKPVKVYSAFGYGTPMEVADPSKGARWHASFYFNGTGSLSAETITEEVISWGYDENGEGYFVLYEKAIGSGSNPTGLSFFSRVDTAKGNKTSQAVKDALKDLNNADIDMLLSKAGTIVVDGARRGLPPLVCDSTCQTNQDLGVGKQQQVPVPDSSVVVRALSEDSEN